MLVFPPQLPERFRRMTQLPYTIGLFVMTWSKHEHMMSLLIARLEDNDYEIVRDEMLDGNTDQFEKRLRKAAANFEKSHSCHKWVEIILARHPNLRSLRHDIIHGWWAGMNENGEYVLKRRPRKTERTVREFSFKELEAAYDDLDSLGLVVMNATRVLEGKTPV
jgi:hypothetical protein